MISRSPFKVSTISSRACFKIILTYLAEFSEVLFRIYVTSAYVRIHGATKFLVENNFDARELGYR